MLKNEIKQPEWVAEEMKKLYPLDVEVLKELRKDSVMRLCGSRTTIVAYYRAKIREERRFRLYGMVSMYVCLFVIGWLYGLGLAALIFITNVAHSVATSVPEIEKDYFRRLDLKAQNPEKFKDLWKN